MTKSTDERPLAQRIAARYVFEERISIFVRRNGERLDLHGWARDLSESGLGAFVGQELAPGELVTVQIPLPASPKELIAAKVAVRAGTRYGFQFTALSAQQRAMIQSATENRAPIPFVRASKE